jgi:hypothetical protein
VLEQPTVIYVILAVAVVAGLVAYAVRRERARVEALRQASLLLGFAFQEKEPGLLQEPWAEAPTFQRGRRRRASNVMRGRVGSFDAVVFDYQYTTGSGKNRRTHRLTPTVVHLPEAALPAFELRPEHLLHRIGAHFGYQDIDFPDQPEFSSRYLLRGEDEAAIRTRFDARVLDRFTRATGWSVEGRGDWLVLHRRRGRIRPDDLRPLTTDAEQVARVFQPSG